MALRLKQHPRGPMLTDEAKDKGFRSYCDLADWAEENLSPGLYFVRADNANIFTGLREVHHHAGRWKSSFWVEGRGCV
jgi:hypothetical protein